jgi:hypothetical protein
MECSMSHFAFISGIALADIKHQLLKMVLEIKNGSGITHSHLSECHRI